MKSPKKVNIRSFSRHLYTYMDDLPIIVYNKYAKKPLFVVISVEDGGELYGIQIKDFIQSNKQAD